jgi:uncharacterized membrane protein YeaQ/YmgE (transglycosylase-associated protein family)
MSLIYFLVIGLCAGWLAGAYMRKGFTMTGNLIIGVVGAYIGGFLFWLVGFPPQGLLARLITATVGAIVLLAILQRLDKVRRR